MRKIILIPALLAFAACGAGKTNELREQAKKTLGVLPAKMPGSEKDTPALVSLGDKLYHETKLSKNDTQSCNSCHNVDSGAGVDNQPTSPGAFGKRGDRNSPTVLNAGFHIAQFWDGRAKDLKEQAKGPILNPGEMAMPNEKAVIEKLKKTEYKDLFAKAYPDEKDPLTYDNLAGAIAAFERTFVTPSRFDDFLNGAKDALTEQEIKGLDVFMSTGCVSCHNGPTVGGNDFKKIGLVHPYETKDEGRFKVTKNEADKFVFKVPSLRNVALTGPYFHDGSVATLEEAVKKMGYHQLGKELSKDDIDSIVAFLKSLSDKKREK